MKITEENRKYLEFEKQLVFENRRMSAGIKQEEIQRTKVEKIIHCSKGLKIISMKKKSKKSKRRKN